MIAAPRAVVASRLGVPEAMLPQRPWSTGVTLADGSELIHLRVSLRAAREITKPVRELRRRQRLRRIVALRQEGSPWRLIGAELGVHPWTVWNLAKRAAA